MEAFEWGIMRTDVWIVRATELALAAVLVAAIGCAFKFDWLGSLTSSVSGMWVDETSGFFQGTLVTEAPEPPTVSHPDMQSPIHGGGT